MPSSIREYSAVFAQRTSSSVHVWPKHAEDIAFAAQLQRIIQQVCEDVSMRLQDMQEHVAKQLNEHRDNAAMSQPGKEWVRGWDDWNSSQGSNAMRAPERKA